MKRSILLLVISFAALCFSAAPARAAGLFGFTVNGVDMQYDASGFPVQTPGGVGQDGVFSANVNLSSGAISFARSVPSTSTSIGAPFLGPGVAGELGDFSISMPIDVLSPTTATVAGGSWTLTDYTGNPANPGDTLTGSVSGGWLLTGPTPSFVGTINNVFWNDLGFADTNFDGDPTALPPVSMSFPAFPQPYSGTMSHLTAAGAAWFGGGSWLTPTGGLLTVQGGTASGTIVPVPAAALLAMLGLSVAGVRLRKFA